MKRRAVIVGIVLALLVASWWGVQRWQLYSTSVWKFIPTNAFFLVQSNHLQDPTYKIQKGGIEMREMPLFNLAARQIDLFRLLSDDSTRTEQLLKGRQITYAFQRTASGRFTYLVFLPLQAFQNYQWLEGPTSSKVRVTSHLYNGQKVYDVSNAHSEPLFAYTFFNNFLVSCTTGDVLEDWIRSATNPLRTPSTNRFETVVHDESELNLYIDNALVSEALLKEANASDGLLHFLSFLPSKEGLHLDPYFSTKNPTFTSANKKISGGYLEALNDQKASPLKSIFFIPNNTALYIG
ncbi:MAG: hypothetical protein R2822_06790 [Spirosomataceae bacterium]